MLTQGGKLDDPHLSQSSSAIGPNVTNLRRRSKSDLGIKTSGTNLASSFAPTSITSTSAPGRGVRLGPQSRHVYAVLKARTASLAFFLMIVTYLISASPDLSAGPSNHHLLHWPLTAHPSHPPDDLDFLSTSDTRQHWPPPAPDHSPSGSLWRALNPQGAPHVSVWIEPWIVLSLRSRHRSPKLSSRRRDSSRARPRSRVKKTLWLAQHVVVPMTATISALWLLLLYLLKDTELLDVQRDRPPGTETNASLVFGATDHTTPNTDPQDGFASTGPHRTFPIGETGTGPHHAGNARGLVSRIAQRQVSNSVNWVTSSALEARVLPNSTPADIVMLAEAAGFVVVLDILGNVSMAPSEYPHESDAGPEAGPIGTDADIGMWRRLSAQISARIKEDADNVTALSVDAERQLILLGTRFGVLHVASISACAALPPRSGIHGQPGGSPAIVHLGTVRKRFFQTIGKVPLSRTHIHASANVVVFADGAIYETTLDKQPRLIRKPEPLDRWTAFEIPLAALPASYQGTASLVGEDGDVHLLGLASSHARLSIWLHEARLNRWTELTKLQLSVGHIVRATAVVTWGPKDASHCPPEGIDFVGAAGPPPGDGSCLKPLSSTTTRTDTPPPSLSGQLTDSSLALLGTNTGRVLVYDLRARQMLQVLEIGDGPVQRIMLPPASPQTPPGTHAGGSKGTAAPPSFVLAGFLTKSHVWLAKVYPDLVADGFARPSAYPTHPHYTDSGSSTSINTSAADMLGDERTATPTGGNAGATNGGSSSKAARLAALFGPANAKYGTHTGFVRRGERGERDTDGGPTNWADSGAMSGPGDGPNQITTPDGQTITLRAPGSSAGAGSSGSGSGPGAGSSGPGGARPSEGVGSTGGYPISTHGARSRRANSTRAMRAHSASKASPLSTSNSANPTSSHGLHTTSPLPSAHIANVGMGIGLSLEGAPDKDVSRGAEESPDDAGTGPSGPGGPGGPGGSDLAHLPEGGDPTDSPPSTPRRDLFIREEPVRMAGSTGCVRGAADGVGRFVVGVRRQPTSYHPLHSSGIDPPNAGARWQVFAVDLLADPGADGAVGDDHQSATAAQAIALGGGGGGGLGDEDRLAFGSVRIVWSDAQRQHLIFSYGNSVAAIHVPSF